MYIILQLIEFENLRATKKWDNIPLMLIFLDMTAMEAIGYVALYEAIGINIIDSSLLFQINDPFKIDRNHWLLWLC